MKTVYLRDGEEVILHKEIDKDNFIIEKNMIYYDYEGGEHTDFSGIQELVKEIYLKPPIVQKQKDFIELLNKIQTKNNELSTIETQLMSAKNEIRKIENQKTDIEKMIINKSEIRNAKRITVFSDYRSYTIDENKKYDLKLTFTLKIIDGKKEAWVTQISEDNYASSKYVNPSYGLIIDADDKEILRIGKEIVANKKEISNFDLGHIPVEYLTEELLLRKKELAKMKNIGIIQDLKHTIKTSQDKLKELIK